MPQYKKVSGGTYWRYKKPMKRAKHDKFDTRIVRGPSWDFKHQSCSWIGPREQVQGRWLSAIWASRIRWVSKVIKDPQSRQRELARWCLKDRISRRFATGDPDLPF